MRGRKRTLLRGTPLATALAALWIVPAVAWSPLSDAPIIWWEDDRNDIAMPEEREPNLRRDQFHTTLVRPARRHLKPTLLFRRIGTLFGDGEVFAEARNVNALDEVPNSTWFTNRIGLFPVTEEEIVRGPGFAGPDLDGTWTIIRAKTEGVTPGFNIRDAKGDVYVIKFDPPGFPRLATGAGAISNRIFHAAGYNVPQDDVVAFRRENLVLGEGVKIEKGGRKRDMTVEDLDEMLARVERNERGEYLAIASRFLDGKPAGPFDYSGRRGDDPNDRVKHQYRRELRGLRVIAAWLNHFDTKQGNTLDMYVEEDGKRFLKHHLIDFTSTLGAGASGPSEKYGHEFGFDAPQLFGRLLTLGLHEDDWRKLPLHELPEIGYFGVEHFDPRGFKPNTPNTAFAYVTRQDAYWGAKIVTAFTDDLLRAICRVAEYTHAEAEEYMARMLAERRDVVGRTFFSEVCPIDFFSVEGGVLRGRDLGVERGLWEESATRYRVRTAFCDGERKRNGQTEWREVARPEQALSGDNAGEPFHAVDFQVDRGDGWSRTVTVYVSRSTGRVVAADRS